MRLIDLEEVYEKYGHMNKSNTGVLLLGLSKLLDDAPIVEAIPKADYEARLRADMVAMLEELDLQIDESAAYNLEVAKVQRLIRDKINALKADRREEDAD